MSTIKQKLRKLAHRVIEARSHQLAKNNLLVKFWWGLQKWFWMLAHEYVRDGVNIRAQSLSFLMIFSLLPMIAGSFFIFTFLSQFGLVQASVQALVESQLNKFPYEHREIFIGYLQEFRDMYLANLMRTSSTIGIFSLVFLLWVGLKAFNNIEETLNFIWSSDSARPVLEKIRNFIVVIVIGPIILVGGSSLPFILEGFPPTRGILELFPFSSLFLGYVLPLAMLFGMFSLLYRYVPVRRVWWRSAFIGALFATIGISITQNLMRMYFLWGTDTVYGLAAAVPLVGFWIYAVWIVVILGGEVSFLFQNQKDIFVNAARDPALREGKGMLVVLAKLYRAFKNGEGPVHLAELRDQSEMNSVDLRYILDGLMRRNIITECIVDNVRIGQAYALARDITDLEIGALLQDYFSDNVKVTFPAVENAWNKSLDHWASFFDKMQISDLIK